MFSSKYLLEKMYSNIFADFSNVSTEFFGARNDSLNKPLHNVYLDKHDDIVVCNNCINGHITQGYILPKELTGFSETLFPSGAVRAFFTNENSNDATIESWARKATVQLDYCCINAIAYTYIWDNVVNQCIKNNLITPCVYGLAYLFMKAMARSPRIPPGTILYRGSTIPFAKYSPDMRFCSFTIDINVARKFADFNGQIGFYKVKQHDYIHGLWFDITHTTSKFAEQEIMLGPGIFMQPIGNPTFYKDYQLQELELKQLDVGTYFMDKYIPDGDEKLYNIIQTGFVLFEARKDRIVYISTEQKKHLRILEDDFFHLTSEFEKMHASDVGFLYIAVQNGQAISIDTSEATTNIFTLEGKFIDIIDFDPSEQSYGQTNDFSGIDDTFNITRMVYKVLVNVTNTIVYCTFEGLCYMLFERMDIKMMPIDMLLEGTQVIHANLYYKNSITVTVTSN